MSLLLFAALPGCSGSPPAPRLSSSATVMAASESRPAWSLRSIGGDGLDSVASVAAMPDGGLVIAGHFEGTLELGSDRLISAGHTDAFIARLAPSGEVDWAQRVGGAGFDSATEVLVDDAGNPVLVGEMSGSVVVGQQRLRARGQSDAFVVSFAGDTAIRWAVAFGEPGWDSAAAAAITADGSIAVVGSTGRIERDDERARADDADVLVALVGSTGTIRWVRRLGGTGWDQGFAVAAHPGGDIEVGGSFGGTLESGSTRLVSAGATDGFALRLSPAGRIVKARRIGAAGADAVTALAIWPDGSSAMAGQFTGSLSFGATPLAGGGESHVFVARSDAGGEPSWALDTGAGEADALQALPDGTLLLAGSYSLRLELVASDPSEVVLHQIGSRGHLRALLRLSGSLVTARALAITRDGDAVVGGSFVRRARLGSHAIEAEDTLDGFLMTTWLGGWGE
jgi:hypothetical protein